jgi:hypothetical protein
VGDLTWYDELRACYRPEHLRILLIGESPPDAGAGERHLFYALTLSRYDNLYGGVAEPLYGEPGPFNLTDKAQTLQAAPIQWAVELRRRPALFWNQSDKNMEKG